MFLLLRVKFFIGIDGSTKNLLHPRDLSIQQKGL